MPYKKKNYSYKKNYRQFKSGYKQVRKLRKLAGQAPLTIPEKISMYAGPIGQLASSVAGIAGLINVETKFIDTTLSSVLIDNTGTQTYIVNDCAEGDDVSQRNGRFILDKAFQYKLRFLNDAAAVNTTIGFAIVYIKDFAQVNLVGAGLAWTDVFNSIDPQALINKGISDNYVIIKRGILQLDNVGNVQKQLNGYVKLTGLHTKFNATTTGQLQKGAIGFMLISDHAAGTTPPHVNGSFRFTFHDN